MIHFRSDARDLLQALRHRLALPDRHGHADRPGRQGHLDPADAACRPASIRRRSIPNAVLDAWVGTGDFAREILVANPWFTHLLLAERYRDGPRLPGGRRGAPVHPDRRLRHEHRHRRRDRSRLEARRRAQGLRRRGPARVLRARAAAGRLSQSPRLGAPHRRAPQDRRALPERARSRGAGAAASRRWAMPRTRAGASSSAIATTASSAIPVRYEPTTAPGARLPSVFLRDGTRALRPARPVVHPAALRRRRSVAADRCRAGAARDGDRRRSGGRADLRGQARAGAARHPCRLARQRLPRRRARCGDRCCNEGRDHRRRHRRAVGRAAAAARPASTSMSTSRRRASPRSAPASRSAPTPRGCCIGWACSRRWTRSACCPRAVHQRRWDDGRTLQRAPLGPEVEATFGAPYYHFHRADLANLLADALPAERAACRPPAGRPGAEGRARRRALRERRVGRSRCCWSAPTASIRSVHALVFGPEKPRFTGCVAWRGLVPAERIAPSRHRGRLAQLDGAGRPRRALLGRRPAGS